MLTAICTLFEGDYHYGVGNLVNSLYNHGFRGVIWAGYRGNLPPWTESVKNAEDYQEFTVAQDCVIRFIKLDTYKCFTNYKPDFMLQLWENYCPETEAIFYFDPDIVNKRRWAFYEEWVGRGIALCEDAYDYMPANDPNRIAWKELAERHGYHSLRQLDRYYNAGFIGVKQNQKDILVLWKNLLETFESAGYFDLHNFHLYSEQYPYFLTDQCVLNLAVTLSHEPLSTVSRLGMDFGNASTYLMSHASGAAIKPWRKKLLLKALDGVPPSLTDKAYWQHTQSPIQLYPRRSYLTKKIELRCASAIGRFIRRS
ncbi:conserved hypothetical protein [Trichormus variabilis ATCC 29413]|uniref:Uncharacterized protein n=2 Tax=Anabaena variabilis TaxID=264691 RepID=Q3MCW0_TRIV2|nr:MULTISPECIES: hypothetical protein [Nostocaceae]ABA21176.1 conserved hypothetical protein [Trichormus variabilis ATCC 29413]MBC1213792.1 hypothetical protein [Trichormus variabilis ARAD]MBC1256957.1 hypothetical protein [Trichormus variabilis V5]MBC1266965.1 hypothetical protein [Trichormus variabilis FSR]MBC1301485.1 hypothetical protein [Trichormus variabilis N2B]